LCHCTVTHATQHLLNLDEKKTETLSLNSRRRSQPCSCGDSDLAEQNHGFSWDRVSRSLSSAARSHSCHGLLGIQTTKAGRTLKTRVPNWSQPTAGEGKGTKPALTVPRDHRHGTRMHRRARCAYRAAWAGSPSRVPPRRAPTFSARKRAGDRSVTRPSQRQKAVPYLRPGAVSR